MLIGELSKRSGSSRDTIRYYEKLLLLSVEGRTQSGGYKRYAQNTLERLQQIHCLKQTEPPRVLRRLQLLRKWSHEKIKQVLT